MSKNTSGVPRLTPGVEVQLVDWRWPVADRSALRMRARISAGMPVEVRALIEGTKRETGFSMSEVVRRCVVQVLAREPFQREGSRPRGKRKKEKEFSTYHPLGARD